MRPIWRFTFQYFIRICIFSIFYMYLFCMFYFVCFLKTKSMFVTRYVLAYICYYNLEYNSRFLPFQKSCICNIWVLYFHIPNEYCHNEIIARSKIFGGQLREITSLTSEILESVTTKRATRRDLYCAPWLYSYGEAHSRKRESKKEEREFSGILYTHSAMRRIVL